VADPISMDDYQEYTCYLSNGKRGLYRLKTVYATDSEDARQAAAEDGWRCYAVQLHPGENA
jgi:hypothetical protein